MKKLLNKQTIISFILGIILLSTINVLAGSNYKSEEIMYNDTNVKEILDELYENKTSKGFTGDLYVWSSVSTSSFSVTITTFKNSEKIKTVNSLYYYNKAGTGLTGTYIKYSWDGTNGPITALSKVTSVSTTGIRTYEAGQKVSGSIFMPVE